MTPTSPKDAKPSVAESLEVAQEALHLGDLDLAAHFFREALERDRTEIRALDGLARVAIALGLLDEARTYLDAAAAVRPEDPDLRTTRGVWHEARGEHDEAARCYRAGAEGNPRSFTARFNFGRVLLLQKLPQRALVELEAASRLDPAQPMVHYDLGLCLQQLGRTGDAIRAFGRVLELNPLYPDGYLTLIDVLEASGEWDGAGMVLRQGLSILPRNYLLLERAVVHCVARGDYAGARRATETLLELDPRDERALLNLTAFALMTGDVETAEQASMRALEAHPGLAEAHTNLATIYETAGLDALARQHYRAAIESDGSGWKALNNLGLLLVATESRTEHEEGVALLERARSLAPPDELRPLLNLALGCWKLGQRERALELAALLLEQAVPGHELAAEAHRFLEAARAEDEAPA